MYIYKLTNQINGKIYVGKTTHKNLNSYLSNKRCLARQGKHSHPIVSAMAKYGVDSFSTEVLATASSSEWLDYLEVLWIMLLDSRNPEVGYNIHAGGGKGALGQVMSAEQKAKIGAANKGRKPKGYVRTELHRQQRRDAMKGNKLGTKFTSESARQAILNETPTNKAKRIAGIQAAWDRKRGIKGVFSNT